MRGVKWSFAALLAAIGFSGRAEAEVVPLALLEQRALEKHALLAESAARTRAASADVRQAQSAYRPRIGVNADANVAPGRYLIELPELRTLRDASGRLVAEPTGDRFLVQGTRPLSERGDAFIPTIRTGVDLSVGQNVYDFGRTASAVAASRAKRRASKAAEAASRGEVLLGVRGAYLGWLSAYELHRIAESTLRDATRRRDRASALVAEGARPRGELAPVEADRLLGELERERSEGELEGARLLLEQSVGEALPPAAEPDPRVLEVTLPAAQTRAASLDVLSAQRAALAASARMQRRANAPVLSAALSVGVHAQGGMERGDWGWRAFPTYLAGLSLAVPLWDGGASRAASEAADARADEVRIRLESEELARAQAYARARLDVAHAERRASTAEALLAVCRTRLADVEAGYELGAMPFEQVQQARAQLRRAETELVMAKIARAEAVLRVAP